MHAPRPSSAAHDPCTRPGAAAAIGIVDPNNPTAAEAPLQDAYNTKVIQLAFLVAMLYTASGALGLGVILTRFMSHPTISGFISGASVIICLSQASRLGGTALVVASVLAQQPARSQATEGRPLLATPSAQFKLIMGVKMPRRSAIHEQLQDIISALPKTKWQELTMGLSLIVMLVRGPPACLPACLCAAGRVLPAWPCVPSPHPHNPNPCAAQVAFKQLKRLKPKACHYISSLGPLFACVVGIGAVFIGKLDQKGIKTVGTIPPGGSSGRLARRSRSKSQQRERCCML